MKKVVLLIALLFLSAPMAWGAPYQVSVSQFVEHPALDAVLRGFQDYLKENNVVVEYKVHNAQANMATAGQIGTQIMGEKPDMIVAIATPTAQAVAQALSKAPHMQKTPFLFTAITDPVAAGLVKDLNMPGGNITGVSDLLPVPEHMGMVKTFLPELKNLGVLYNAGEANSKVLVEEVTRVGKEMGFEVTGATVAKTGDVFQAAKSLVGKVDAIFIPTDNTVVSGLEAVVKVCDESDLPLFCADVDSVARGAVAAMGFDYYAHGRQTGAMAKRIFEGADPATTPVETQEELSLHINAKSAAAMNVTVPEALKVKADKIYE